MTYLCSFCKEIAEVAAGSCKLEAASWKLPLVLLGSLPGQARGQAMEMSRSLL